MKENEVRCNATEGVALGTNIGAAMDDPADDIRRRMQSIRRDVSSDVHQIVDTAHELVDWRAYVRRNPWLCVGGAFVLGLAVSPRPRQMLNQLNGGTMKSLGRQAGKISAAPGGLAMKAVTVVGPIAARAAASYLLKRLGGLPPQADDEDPSRFEQVGKPR